MSLIRYTKNQSYKRHLALILFAFLAIIKALIEIISLGFLTTDLYANVLFLEKLNDWIEK